jgi:hypothetical protein
MPPIPKAFKLIHLEEIRVLVDYRLAQQLRESYPQFIGHRAFSFG